MFGSTVDETTRDNASIKSGRCGNREETVEAIGSGCGH